MLVVDDERDIVTLVRTALERQGYDVLSATCGDSALELFAECDPDRFDEHVEEGEGPIHAPRKVGRNEPCPCGSGKKYKKCCGRLG